MKFPGGERFLPTIDEHRALLHDRPYVFCHGDYHRGNMMLDRTGGLRIIGFARAGWGDPWEDKKAITRDVQMHPRFAAGRIDGYFGGSVPADFWRLLALYISVDTISSLPWAVPFGEEEIAVMTRLAAQMLDWYDNMTNPVPRWYRENVGRP